jgi:tripartite-type tricarboxylate transporter receptor subunit TctC
MGIFVAALLAAGLTTPIQAEDAASYPSKPIKIIVPQSPGGGTDVACRMIAEAAERLLGQRVIVENKPGAGGRIGAAMVAKAAPDGYTLLYTPKPPLTIQQHLNLKLDFDPEKDFKPVAIMTWAPGLLMVRSSFPAKTMQEFINYAKKNPGKVTFGIQGIGAEFHVSLEQLRDATGVKIVAVPYKGGAPAIIDLLADRLDAMILVPAATKDHIAGGRLVPLATLEPERVPDYPKVPTVAEVGLPQLTGSPWFGFVAPAGTPKPIIDKLAGVFAQLQKDPALVKRLNAVGYTLRVAGPEESAAIIAKERSAFGKIATGGRLDRPN